MGDIFSGGHKEARDERGVEVTADPGLMFLQLGQHIALCPSASPYLYLSVQEALRKSWPFSIKRISPPIPYVCFYSIRTVSSAESQVLHTVVTTYQVSWSQLTR